MWQRTRQFSASAVRLLTRHSTYLFDWLTQRRRRLAAGDYAVSVWRSCRPSVAIATASPPAAAAAARWARARCISVCVSESRSQSQATTFTYVPWGRRVGYVTRGALLSRNWQLTGMSRQLAPRSSQQTYHSAPTPLPLPLPFSPLFFISFYPRPKSSYDPATSQGNDVRCPAHRLVWM